METFSNKTLTVEDFNSMEVEELAEQLKAGNLELCVEPLSEWGSDLETLFQKLEKGVMQWYETGVKRSLTICFTDYAPDSANASVAPARSLPEDSPPTREATTTSLPLTTPAISS
jgi:hypothetical protein